MALASGIRVGPYEINGLIGVGGMGEVYRATDTKLKRDVAIKVLPAALASDPDRLARLQREAELLAALNHPNIAAIYGVEDFRGGGTSDPPTIALAMELVEGPTLADRIAYGAIPFDEALGLAKQIAEALEAAHERGIVHRDLKPANIKVRTDGRVKVLDFGLAKEHERGSGSSGPGLTSVRQAPALTEMGMILGTAAYMSPEQAKGRPSDKRSDIWAFGCVLYEMLTGRCTFAGEDFSDTLAAVLRGQPDWSALPPETPIAIRRLLRRLLAREWRARLADMADARLEIEEASREEPIPTAVPPSRRREYAWASAAVALLLTTIGLALWTPTAEAPDASPSVRFDLLPPDGVTGIGSVGLSPNGRLLAFVAMSGGRAALWIRPLDAVAAQIVQGTEGMDPDFFWSPDSRQIGFFSDGGLKTVSATGGSPRVVATLPGGAKYTGTWGVNGDILLGEMSQAMTLSVAPLDVAAAVGGLLRVSEAGGEPAPASELDGSQERFHTLPHFLPDGRHYLFLAGGRESGSYVGSLDSSARVPLPGVASAVVYSPSGHVLFVRDGALMAQRFDPDRLELSGQATAIVNNFVRPGVRTGSFSVSASGTLTYSLAGAREQSRLVWFDRSGTELGVAAPNAVYVNPELSKDDRYVAWDEGPFPSSDTWVRDLERGLTTRFTSTPGPDGIPQWSPDGKTIVFRADGDYPGQMYQLAFGVVGDRALLLTSDEPNTPTDWSVDGRYLVYASSDDVWLLQLSDRTPQRVTQTPFVESDARISPDGRWIAYQSNEGGIGRPVDVYLHSLSGNGTKVQVSTMGGIVPRWSRDGKELYYLTPDRMLMAVPIDFDGDEPRIGVPSPLFQARVSRVALRAYAVSRDGRFLVNTLVDDAARTPIRVALNWFEELDRLAAN